MLKYCTNLEDLSQFPEDIALSLYERPRFMQDTKQQTFFSYVMEYEFSVSGFVSKNDTNKDILYILSSVLPKTLLTHEFMAYWIQDMADICRIFCTLQTSNRVGFWIGTKRGCKRYHLDFVPMRLLVTYAGAGTQWLPSDASNWQAYANGENNDAICLDPNKIEQINPWDVALFRGEEKGLLHRTPDEAIHQPSILMRLDSEIFQTQLSKTN